jgi:PKD repeat protein
MITKLRALFFFGILICLINLKNADGQSGVWTWMNGDPGWNSSVHGAQGQFDSLYHPLGIYERISWKDNQGNLWYMCDGDSLWKYDMSINQWAWMNGSGDYPSYGFKGVPSPTNTPGFRQGGTPAWTDINGNFWLFSGFNYGQGADLWKYDPMFNEWTWMSGGSYSGDHGVYGIQGVPSILNYPAFRRETCACWVDSASNSLWLFGGWSFSNHTNDLWKYDINTNEWTWMKGDTIDGTPPTYGQKGIPDTANSPGSRWSFCKWTDDNGVFWLFGGNQFSGGYNLNDTWKYIKSSNSWVWMNGRPNTPNGFATGTCIEDTLNLPREQAENKLSWKDNCGNFWTLCDYNQVWKFNPSTSKWVLTEGNYMFTSTVNYGIKGVSDPSNHPFFCPGSEGWTDNNGNFWYLENLNSVLWKFEPNLFCGGCTLQPASQFNADSTSICPGGCIGFNNFSANANSFEWSFPGGTPSSSTDTNPQNICYATPGTYDVKLIASNANSNDTLLMPGYITVYPFPPPQVISQISDTLFANAGGTFYQWYYNGNLIPGATEYFHVATMNGDYNVLVTDSNGCEAEAIIFNVMTSVEHMITSHNELKVYPEPSGEIIFIKWNLPLEGPFELSVLNLIGQQVISESGQELIQLSKTGIDISHLSTGMYFLELHSKGNSARIKFAKK